MCCTVLLLFCNASHVVALRFLPACRRSAAPSLLCPALLPCLSAHAPAVCAAVPAAAAGEAESEEEEWSEGRASEVTEDALRHLSQTPEFHAFLKVSPYRSMTVQQYNTAQFSTPSPGLAGRDLDQCCSLPPHTALAAGCCLMLMWQPNGAEPGSGAWLLCCSCLKPRQPQPPLTRSPAGQRHDPCRCQHRHEPGAAVPPPEAPRPRLLLAPAAPRDQDPVPQQGGWHCTRVDGTAGRTTLP